MKRQNVFLLLTLLSVAVLGGVVNVTAVSRWPWNGKVDITCEVLDVTAAPGGILSCSVQLKGYDKVKNTEIGIKTLSVDGVNFQRYEDGTVSELEGTTYHLVWDVAKDCPTLNAAAFSVSAIVTITNRIRTYKRRSLTGKNGCAPLIHLDFSDAAAKADISRIGI